MSSVQPDREALLRNVARHLSLFGHLGPEDLAAVQSLSARETARRRGSDLGAGRNETPWIIMAGWACHMRPQSRGRRQIFGFLLPGDVIGSFWRQPEFTFHDTVALTALQVASAGGLLATDADGSPRHPTLVQAARRAEDHAQHRLLNHIVRLGARDAYSGLAHLLLELHDRLERVGLVRDGAFWLPLGQRTLAQAMGFSLAHINHTLQRMAGDGLFETNNDTMRLLQPERMAAIAEFSIEAPQARPASAAPELHENAFGN